MKHIDDNLANIEDVSIDGIDLQDWPDFVDSFVDSATLNGKELTEVELDYLSDNHPEWMNDKIFEKIYG